MLNFDFVEKALGIVSAPHLLYDSSRKMFLVLYSINRPNFIVWLPLILEILVNMCIAIVCFPGCDVINIKINLIFLIKLFFTWPKSQDKNLNIFRMKRAFKMKWKVFFGIFHNFSHFPHFVKLVLDLSMCLLRCLFSWNILEVWNIWSRLKPFHLNFRVRLQNQHLHYLLEAWIFCV